MYLKYGTLVSVGVLIAALVGCGGGSSSGSGGAGGGGGGGGTPTVSSIALSPANSAVTMGKNLALKATASMSDGSQQDVTSAATWSSSDSTIATVSAGTATGVKPGGVTITAASGGKNGTTTLNVTDLAVTNAAMNGSYTFLLLGIDNVGPTFALGTFKADGNGNITGGAVDVNTAASGPAPAESAIPAGTYAIGADGRGTAKLTISGQSISFAFAIAKDGSKGYLIQADGKAAFTGTFEKQTGGVQLSGAYVFRIAGVQLGAKQLQIGEVGSATAAAGALTGFADENFNGTNKPNVAITGSTFTAADSNNRGTLKLTLADGTAVDFAYYLVSANKFFMISTDAGASVDMLGGIAETQSSVAALLGQTYVVLMDHGATLQSGDFEHAGGFQLDGSGGLTQASMLDDLTANEVMDTPIVLNAAANAYTAPNAAGRGTLSATGGAADATQSCGFSLCRNYVFYTVTANKAYMLESTAFNNSLGAGRGAVGEFETAPGTATAAGMGDFIFSQVEHGENNPLLQVGQVRSDGSGHLNGVVDFVHGAGAANATISTDVVSWTVTPTDPTNCKNLATVTVPVPLMGCINPANVQFIQNYFLYVRPDGNRMLLIGNLPDTDGLMDMQ